MKKIKNTSISQKKEENYEKKNKITCTCKHLFYDTAGYLIADSYVVDKNCNDALDQLNNACDVVTPFLTLSDIQQINSYRCVRKSLEEAISVVLERWGGHLVRDNFNIAIRETIGQDNGVTLRYGKNIQDIQVKEDWSNVATKILPVGKDGLTLEELYITTSDLSPTEPNYGLLYDKPYTKTITFMQDLPEDEYKDDDGKLNEEAYNTALLQDLRTQAIQYIRDNCIPKINYSEKANSSAATIIGRSPPRFPTSKGRSHRPRQTKNSRSPSASPSASPRVQATRPSGT